MLACEEALAPEIEAAADSRGPDPAAIEPSEELLVLEESGTALDWGAAEGEAEPCAREPSNER